MQGWSDKLRKDCDYNYLIILMVLKCKSKEILFFESLIENTKYEIITTVNIMMSPW